jgi:hypothetical protein
MGFIFAGFIRGKEARLVRACYSHVLKKEQWRNREGVSITGVIAAPLIIQPRNSTPRRLKRSPIESG